MEKEGNNENLLKDYFFDIQKDNSIYIQYINSIIYWFYRFK